MAIPLKTFIMLILVSLCNFSFGQASFHIHYYFKLYNEKGEVVSQEDLKGGELCIDAHLGQIYPSEAVSLRYDTGTRYFYFDIKTIEPVFTLIWKYGGQDMKFSMNHATSYKDVYLDSLYFRPGDFLIKGPIMDFIVYEDDHSQHIVFRDVSEFKTSSVSTIDRKRKKSIKCW